MVSERPRPADPYFIERLASADVVVLCDGHHCTHVRVWRANAFGDAINARRLLVAIAARSLVLGDVMIDPRGGACRRPDSAISNRLPPYCVPSSEDQMLRTPCAVG